VEVRAKTRNIVAVLDLGRPVSLEAFAERVNSVYEPEPFTALVMRCEVPRATFLVFLRGRW